MLWPLDWKSFSPFEKFFYPTDILIIAVNFVIIIIFRWFAKEFAKRITEVDEVIIDIIKKQVYLEY